MLVYILKHFFSSGVVRMFEVVLDGLEYIRDVPVELTESAVSAGVLRKGCVVGLTVHTVSDPENSVLVEVKLREEGQEKLIKPGLRLPLEGRGGRFSFAECWRQYP